MLIIIVNGEIQHELEVPETIWIKMEEGGLTLYSPAKQKGDSYIKDVNESVWGLINYTAIFNDISYSVSRSCYRLYNEQSSILEEIVFYGTPAAASN